MDGFDRIGGNDLRIICVREGNLEFESEVRFLSNTNIAVIIQAPESRLFGGLAAPFWGRRKMKDSKSPRRPNFSPKSLKYVYYPDIYFLLRALKYGDEYYLQEDIGEIFRLEKVLVTAYELNGVLLNLRKGNVDELVGQIIELVDQAISETNPGSLNELKKEILEQLSAVGNIEDSLGRVNNGALLARLVAIKFRAMQREADAIDINAVWALRRKVISILIDILEFQVKTATNFLEQVLKDWQVVQTMRRVRVADQLEVYAGVFSAIDIKPFLVTFQYSADEFKRAAECLRTNQVEKAEGLLQTAYASFKLRKIRVDLERVLFEISRKKRFAKNSFDLAGNFEKLRNAMAEMNELNTVGMRDFNAKFMTTNLQRIIRLLEQGSFHDAHTIFEYLIQKI